MKHLSVNPIRAVVYAGLAVLCAAQTACAPASGSEADFAAEPSVLGEYGPKDWRSGAQGQFCTESGGIWSCAGTGGISPPACSGAIWIGGVFRLLPGFQLWSTFGTESYVGSGTAFQGQTSGLALTLHEQASGDFIVEIQAGCAMLYVREALP